MRHRAGALQISGFTMNTTSAPIDVGSFFTMALEENLRIFIRLLDVVGGDVVCEGFVEGMEITSVTRE